MEDRAFKNVRVQHKLLTTCFGIASRLPTARNGIAGSETKDDTGGGLGGVRSRTGVYSGQNAVVA
jgi:hypothetical protein